MTKYTVNFTDSSKTPISISEDEIDTSTDLSLFGRTTLNYGKDMNENILHLLENFSCPELGSTGRPNLSLTADNALAHPIEGQGWFNSTKKIPCVYDGANWVPLYAYGSIASNWGVIADGQTLPLPVSPTGITYGLADCSWVVSPFGFPNAVDYMLCRTSTTGVVTSRYSLVGDSAIVSGYANYLIIAIKGNVNLGSNNVVIVVTPTPTPSPTITVTPSSTPSVSITPSVTPTISGTPNLSSTPVASVTPTPTPPVTPTISVTPTLSPPPVSVTPVPSITPTPTHSPPPPLAISLHQGDGSTYVKLHMGASLTGGTGSCGDGSYKPGNFSPSQYVHIGVSGGVAPYTVTIADWADTASMSGERFDPFGGGFTGTGVGGDPLNNPTWTWTGALDSGFIVWNGNGICGVDTVLAEGTATLHVVDNVGSTATATLNWHYSRDMDGGGGGDGCVVMGSMVHGFDSASHVNVGSDITIVNTDTMTLDATSVTMAKTSMQPCVRVTTAIGIVLECSTSAPLSDAEGNQILAPNTLNKVVKVYDNGEFSTDIVVSVEDIGKQQVKNISCGDNYFLAGRDAGRYLLHHNKIIP